MLSVRLHARHSSQFKNSHSGLLAWFDLSPLQLTTLLRNLADLPDSRPLFVSFSILPELCRVLRHHSDDQDICTNISRIYR